MTATSTVLSSLSGIAGLSSVTMAAASVANTVCDLTHPDLDFASICPAEDVPLGDEEDQSEKSVSSQSTYSCRGQYPNGLEIWAW